MAHSPSFGARAWCMYSWQIPPASARPGACARAELGRSHNALSTQPSVSITINRGAGQNFPTSSDFWVADTQRESDEPHRGLARA